MLSCTLLAKLPADWQEKMHKEIASKLNLCIKDVEVAKNVAVDTWRYLSQDNLNKKDLTVKLKPYLPDHASDFTDWVTDFSQKTLEYYLETVSNPPKNEDVEEKKEPKAEKSIDKAKGKEDGNLTNLSETKSRVFKQAIKNIAREKSPPQNAVDPLDDTLDNLIRKEKIARLQGQTNVSLGVQTKSERFKPDRSAERNSRKKPKLKSTLYKNLTLVNAEGGGGSPRQEPPKPVTKVPKLCMNFPNCEFGENCRYVHPAQKICKNWPDCFFGDKCLFIHPNK